MSGLCRCTGDSFQVHDFTLRSRQGCTTPARQPDAGALKIRRWSASAALMSMAHGAPGSVPSRRAHTNDYWMPRLARLAGTRERASPCRRLGCNSCAKALGMICVCGFVDFQSAGWRLIRVSYPHPRSHAHIQTYLRPCRWGRAASARKLLTGLSLASPTFRLTVRMRWARLCMTWGLWHLRGPYGFGLWQGDRVVLFRHAYIPLLAQPTQAPLPCLLPSTRRSMRLDAQVHGLP